MDTFSAVDIAAVTQLASLGHYSFVIIGSGIGGGILAEELAKRKRRVLLIEKGPATFTTHVLNTSRPDYGRGRDNSPKGNEVVYNTLKARVQTTEDSESYAGGPLYCLGGRSNVWGLRLPETDAENLIQFPKTVKKYLVEQGYDDALGLLTNYSQTKDKIYPEGYVSTEELQEAKATLEKEISTYIAAGDHVRVAALAMEVISPAPYRFPQGAYSTSVALLNRVYARDEYLTVLMGTEVLQVNTPERGMVSSVTVRTNSTQEISQISTEGATVILSAGSINTATIALRSGLQNYNPLVGKGLTDHEIWGLRFQKENVGGVKDPFDLQCRINICGTTALLTVTVNSNFYIAGSLPTSQYIGSQGNLLDQEEGRKKANEGAMDTIDILLEYSSPLNNQNEVLNLPTPDPVIRIKPRTERLDEKSQIEMQKLATAIRNQVIVLRWPRPYTDKIINLPTPRMGLLGFGIFAHEVGTMRMADSNGVVNADLRFNGIANLYACDLSVLPISPRANPTLTLSALALRLAKHLTGS